MTAFVCLQCGRRGVVPHGDRFKCRDCGTEEPFNPIKEGYACGWCFDTGIHHYNTDDMDRLTMPCPNRDCPKSPDWWHVAAAANAEDEALTFATVVHEIREKLVELQNAPHEEHAGPICPICVLTNRMLARLQEQSDA